MPITNTWRKRLHGTGAVVWRGLLTAAIISCSIIAVADIMDWITDQPIDVAGPARSAVNRADAVGAFALGCVERSLTATQAQEQSLGDCWTTRDQVRLPTTPPVIIGHPRVSAATLQDDIGTGQQWSVVVEISERPYDTATPHDKCYRLPVLWTQYGLRATAWPGATDCPGPGADIGLGYPASPPDTSPVFTTVAGFITAYLTAAGGVERWVTPESGLLPVADYRSVKVTKLVANHATPDRDVPANEATVRVLATVDAVDNQYAPRHQDYALTLQVASGRWSVAAIDRSPLLARAAEPTPVASTAH
jgi:hypothetical protein